MIARTLRTVGGLDRELRILFVTTLIHRSGTMAHPFLTAYLLLSGDLGTGRISLIVSMFGVGALCADLASAMLLGRLGARTTMLCGLAGQAGLLVVTPSLRDTWVIGAAVFLWGFCYELFTPASYSATIDGSTPQERKIAFSCNRLAINVGMGIGPAIGGVVFAASPVALFWINALLVLGAAAHLAVRTRPARGPNQGAVPADRERRRMRLKSATVREETRFWTVFGLSLPIQLAFSLPAVFVSTYVIVGLGLPSYWVGVVLTVNAAAIVLFEIPVNTAMARVGHLPPLLIGYGLTGVGFLLMGLAGSGPALVLATLVWTAGEMVVFPGLLTYVSALSEPDMSDRNMSLFSGGVNIAFIAAPQVALLLSGPGHPALPWTVAGSAVTLACVLLLAARTSSFTWYEPAPHGGKCEETGPHPVHRH